ncbi:MAG: YHS domain-containing protein, partial [Parasphingorhabdus sp.]
MVEAVHTHDCCHHDVIDPVCGMTVDPAKTAHHSEYQGAEYHFCSAGCKTKFSADPERYLSGEPVSQEP